MSFGGKISGSRPGIRTARGSGLAAVIASVLVAGLAACGSGSGSGSQATAPAAAAKAGSTASAAAAKAGAAVKVGSAAPAGAAGRGLTPDGTKLKFADGQGRVQLRLGSNDRPVPADRDGEKGQHQRPFQLRP